MARNHRNRNNKYTKRRPQSGTKAVMNTLHQDLTKLTELQMAQEIRFRPEKPDVPRLRFNRDTWFNIELSFVTNVALSTTGPTFGAQAVSLASAPNYGNYTACFDQFRILQANVKFVPVGIPTGSGGYLLSIIDYDDANVPTSQSTYLGYDTLKLTPAGVIDERTFNPRIAVAVYNSVAFTGFANMGSRQWIDSGSAGTQYYGLKYYTPQGTSGQSITLFWTIMVQFRAQRAP